jgi:glycosyltransferase involved in cell wall biosynthesis
VKPLVSVLIPAYNEKALLPRSIHSVQAAFRTQNASHEIIVCDNNSTDGTGALAQSLGARVVFEPHNQIARARNRAAQEATGEWLLFIDAVSELTAPLLQETLRAMRTPGICGGGAQIEFMGPKAALKSTAVGFWNRLSSAMKWMAGSYIFCRRDAWQETGGFDERYYAAEEIIFSRALKRWAADHGEKVMILPTEKIVTSARKFEMYSVPQLFRLFFVSSLPGAWRRRESCRIWYER